MWQDEMMDGGSEMMDGGWSKGGMLCAWARKKSPAGKLPFTIISLKKNYGRVGDQVTFGIKTLLGSGRHVVGQQPERLRLLCDHYRIGELRPTK